MSYTEHFSVDCPSTIAKLITTTHHNKEKNHELEKKNKKKNRQTTRRSGNTVTKPWLVLNLRLIGLVDGASILHQSQIRIQQKQGSGWFLFI